MMTGPFSDPEVYYLMKQIKKLFRIFVQLMLSYKTFELNDKNFSNGQCVGASGKYKITLGLQLLFCGH